MRVILPALFKKWMSRLAPLRRRKTVDLPAGLETIGDGAFRSCTSLISITIPSSVTSIGSSAFSSCSNLTTVTIESETVYNSATSTSACGYLLRYATSVRVLADFVSDSHSYINTTNFPYTSDKVVDGKTYRVYSTEPLV